MIGVCLIVAIPSLPYCHRKTGVSGTISDTGKKKNSPITYCNVSSCIIHRFPLPKNLRNLLTGNILRVSITVSVAENVEGVAADHHRGEQLGGQGKALRPWGTARSYRVLRHCGKKVAPTARRRTVFSTEALELVPTMCQSAEARKALTAPPDNHQPLTCDTAARRCLAAVQLRRCCFRCGRGRAVLTQCGAGWPRRRGHDPGRFRRCLSAPRLP